jgi:hypothetical protein
MTERAPDRGERNPGIPAGRLDDALAGLQITSAVGSVENAIRHPVLDASGEVEVLCFCVDHPAHTGDPRLDCQHWRVADEVLERLELPRKRHSHRIGERCDAWYRQRLDLQSGSS